MVLPLSVGLGAQGAASAAAGFNPLSMLAAPILGGGLPGFSDQGGAYSNAVLDQMFNSPFNVGSGSQVATADKSGGAGNAPAIDVGQLVPVAILGIVAWAAVSLLK